MGVIPDSIADHVGNTPMVRLTRLVPDDVHVELYGKLESFNPGGSVKDRIGVAMLEAAEREGIDAVWVTLRVLEHRELLAFASLMADELSRTPFSAR